MRNIYMMLGMLWGTLNLLSTSTTFAQEKTESDAEAIGSIQIEFCHTPGDITTVSPKEISIDTEPDKQIEMCFRLTNISEKDHSFGLNFVDGIYNNQGNKSCDLEEVKNRFGIYVTEYEQEISLKGGSSVEIRPQLSLPETSIGKVLGCMTMRPLSSDETDMTGDGMKIIVRRGLPIEVLNKGLLHTNLVVTSDIVPKKKKPFFVDRELVVQGPNDRLVQTYVGLVNKGAVAEDIQVRGTITDILGRKTNIGETSFILVPGKKDIVTFAYNVPWYKLWYTTDIQVMHTPDLVGVPIEYIHGVSDTEVIPVEGNFFLFPRWLVVLLLLLTLVALETKRRKNKRQYADIVKQPIYKGMERM